MTATVVFVIILSILHVFFGVISFIVGALSSIQASVWLAHTVSPIWSGVFFILCGCTGFIMSRKKSQYSILCFAALCALTVITGLVNMQLLRVGLVNYTTLGKNFQKETKDISIIISMITGGCELLNCFISLLVSFKLNHDAKHNRFKSERKQGSFYVQIVSDKEIVVVQTKTKKKKQSRLKSIISTTNYDDDSNMRKKFTSTSANTANKPTTCVNKHSTNETRYSKKKHSLGDLV